MNANHVYLDVSVNKSPDTGTEGKQLWAGDGRPAMKIGDLEHSWLSINTLWATASLPPRPMIAALWTET